MHEFNLSGFKLDRPGHIKLLILKSGTVLLGTLKHRDENKTFLSSRYRHSAFSRYFLLPARFQSYNAPVWRWGGGEFTMPIKITYLNGRDLHTDVRESGIIHEACKN